jgi:hypothetical protein
MLLADGPTMDLQPFNIQITYNHSLCKREILHRTLEPPTLFQPLMLRVLYLVGCQLFNPSTGLSFHLA